MSGDDSYTRHELELVNDLATKILSAPTLSSAIVQLLDCLPNLIVHEKSFFTREPMSGGNRRRIMWSHTMSDDELTQYETLYMQHDYTAWYLEQDGVHVYRDSDVVSDEVIARSRIYTEWVRPMGMRYVCGSVMRRDGVRAADLTLFRAQEHGDFTDHEVFLLLQVTRQVECWLAGVRPMGERRRVEDELRDGFETLTSREREVVELACTGMSVREMSDYLAISYGTCRRHLANIYEKIGIGSRVQLIERVGRSHTRIAFESD